MLKKLFLFSLILVATQVSAQHKKKKPKNSQAQGTLYGYLGYNVSAYTKSDLRFVGQGYDFTLKNSVAKDNPSPFGAAYFDPKRITVPQFNARIGYYFKNHWAISFGYDHMKYIFQDNNHVLLDGNIEPGIDQTTNWSGTYKDVPVVTNRETFHYENSNGLNNLRFGIERTDNLFGLKNWFVFSSLVGVSVGGILSYNDFNWAGKKDMVTISLSGYALSGHAAMRFEFFKHVFVQTNFSGGFMHQVKVKTRPDDRSAFARQTYGFGMFDTSVGFLLYIKPTNNCSTCPTW